MYNKTITVYDAFGKKVDELYINVWDDKSQKWIRKKNNSSRKLSGKWELVEAKYIILDAL